MNIWLNGEEEEVQASTVDELMVWLEAPIPTLLVEHNGLALRRDEWPRRNLNPGDRIEIIRIVAGG